MITKTLAVNETERLRTLHKADLLDSTSEQEFDEIVGLASRICEAPISLITLIDTERQWFKARKGTELKQTTRNISFCSHAILQDDFFEVPDTLMDDRFSNNPMVVQEPNVRYYGGIPLIADNGYKLGTLCVIDKIPRNLSTEQMNALRVLANQVMKLISIRLLNKDLQKLTKVQNRTAAVMAHDIRNSLMSIKSTYELKQNGLLSIDDEKLLEQMVPRQLDATLEMLSNIVEWGKLQIKPCLKESRTNVQEAFGNCINLVVLQAKAKGNEIINNVPKSLWVACAPDLLEFILRNLLNNASKFTNDGTITINAKRKSSHIHVTVTDTGIGMNAKQVENFSAGKFGSFTNGTNSEKGSGLGLMLIWEFLESLGSILCVNSVEGKGTIFSFNLPAADRCLN